MLLDVLNVIVLFVFASMCLLVVFVWISDCFVSVWPRRVVKHLPNFLTTPGWFRTRRKVFTDL